VGKKEKDRKRTDETGEEEEPDSESERGLAAGE
jgi:hypothetical protein